MTLFDLRVSAMHVVAMTSPYKEESQSSIAHYRNLPYPSDVEHRIETKNMLPMGRIMIVTVELEQFHAISAIDN